MVSFQCSEFSEFSRLKYQEDTIKQLKASLRETKLFTGSYLSCRLFYHASLQRPMSSERKIRAMISEKYCKLMAPVQISRLVVFAEMLHIQIVPISSMLVKSMGKYTADQPG